MAVLIVLVMVTCVQLRAVEIIVLLVITCVWLRAGEVKMPTLASATIILTPHVCRSAQYANVITLVSASDILPQAKCLLPMFS